MGMPDAEMAKVIAAIGNHHEIDGDPVNAVAAAVMLADKSDVHRTRVRNPDFIKFDIHDRVNYAVEKSFLNVTRARSPSPWSSPPTARSRRSWSTSRSS